MKRFVAGEDRRQGVLLPEYLDDFVAEENQVRVIEAFVDELDLTALGFDGITPAATGRPSYHPSVLLKIYIYGYINQIASSRRLEREARRNVELMWLTGRLAPDFKTIADFRKDNGPAIRATCRRFVEMCRRLNLFAHAVAAIDGSKFKAVNARQELHARQAAEANGAGGGEHRTLFVGAGNGGPARRRVGGSQVGAAEGQDRLPARPDAQVQGDRSRCGRRAG